MFQTTRILYLITQSEFGGAQRYIFDLATNLPAEKYQIAVAAGSNEELFSRLREYNIKTYRLKNLIREINPLKDLTAYFEIKKLLKEIKPDILHLNSSKAGVIGAMAGRHIGIKKIIYTVHGFVFNEPLPKWKKLFYLITEKFSARYKDKLICVSEFDRQIGIKKNIAGVEKLVTIHNGIGQINFLDQKRARQELKLDQNKIVIGTIANFYLTKGLIYFIQTAKIVNQAKPEITFTIIGDGQERNLLQNEIKKQGLENNFFLIGQKQKAWQFLLAFDVYVCSSLKEGFPFSLLEAMSAGLPIVTTKVGGISEMIKDNQSGLLVKPADPKELAEKIIEVIDNKSLAEKLGTEAQIRVRQDFSLEKMIIDTQRIYQD